MKYKLNLHPYWLSVDTRLGSANKHACFVPNSDIRTNSFILILTVNTIYGNIYLSSFGVLIVI